MARRQRRGRLRFSLPAKRGGLARCAGWGALLFIVMAGLVPAIHVFKRYLQVADPPTAPYRAQNQHESHLVSQFLINQYLNEFSHLRDECGILRRAKGPSRRRWAELLQAPGASRVAAMPALVRFSRHPGEKPGSSVMDGFWIPACAGMTRGGVGRVQIAEAVVTGFPAFAGDGRGVHPVRQRRTWGRKGERKKEKRERETENRGGYCAAWATRSVTGSICISVSMRPRSFWNSASMRPVSWRPRGTWMVIGLTNLLLTRIS